MEGVERLNNFSLSAFSTLLTYPTLSWNVSIRILCKWGSEASMEIGQYGIRSVNLTLRPCSLQSICSDFSPINKQNIAVQMRSLIGSWLWWLENMKNSHLTSLMPSPTDYRVETTGCKNQLADVGTMLETCDCCQSSCVKPAVLDERLVEEQKDVFEMWGILSSSASHFLFLNRHGAVANAVVFVKWGSGCFFK